ncbi:MAG: hypothetical protein JW869_07300 [Candidatus Omnitrophica bacterium]|nr:hypothetical protein [Candidatus Omnitrophota bacterium]
MLKRYQILLDDWLVSEAKKMAQRYRMSFSEIVRAALCSKYLDCVYLMYPNYDNKIDQDELKKVLKSRSFEKMGREEFQKRLSKLYFEAQKAIEFVNKQEARQSVKV